MMGYQLLWLIQDRVIYIRQFGVINRDELIRYLDESMVMRDEANARLGEGGPLVHTITDARAVEKNELQLSDLQTMLHSLRAQRVGWSIYVNESKIVRFLASVAHQMVGVRHSMCSSMEDALAFLNKVDETLPPLTMAQVDALLRKQAEQPPL